MSNAVPSRLGQVDKAGDALALFYKIFTGEVLTAFENNVIMRALHRTRSITHGKSAGFAAVFKTTAAYHTPGAEILGTPIAHNEVVIPVDQLLIADAFIANIDEAMNHYDVRAPYSKELGEALALAYDRNVARNVIRAARGAALFTGDVGGQEVAHADAATNAVTLGSLIWDAKRKMEEADVPVESTQVNAVLRPLQWYLLAQEPTLIMNRDVDGDGSYSKGKFSLIGGVNVHKSNALPWGTNDSANTDIPTDYRINMTSTVGAVFTESAAATVQLLGLGLESAYDIRRQGTLIVGKYAVGHGPLRNKCAVEITTAV